MDLTHHRSVLKASLAKEFYLHSLAVAETASMLADKYGVNKDKAYAAGLLHDYGKRYSFKQLKVMAERLSLKLDSISYLEPKLLHAPVGAALLPLEQGVEDKDILDAVAYHTTGKANMTLMAKIVYLSDFIEPGRKYRGVRAVRRLATVNLDRAILQALNYTLLSVFKRNLLLHPLSVEFRNDLVQSLK